MNVAGLVVFGTRKVVVGFQTRPVGAAFVGGFGFFGLTVWQALLGTLPPGSGILTRSGGEGCGTPVPS